MPNPWGQGSLSLRWEPARYSGQSRYLRRAHAVSDSRGSPSPHITWAWTPPWFPRLSLKGRVQGDPRAPELSSNDIGAAGGVAAGSTGMTRFKICETWAISTRAVRKRARNGADNAFISRSRVHQSHRSPVKDVSFVRPSTYLTSRRDAWLIEACSIAKPPSSIL